MVSVTSNHDRGILLTFLVVLRFECVGLRY